MSAKTLFEHFEIIQDPRQDWKTAHNLYDILVLAVCAVIAGMDGWDEIEMFGKSRLDWLRKFGEFKNGVPSQHTIARVISRISLKKLETCFISWMQSCQELTKGSVIAIDGKTLRRSFKNGDHNTALHMVSAFAAENNVVLGQVKTDAKSNEITAIPALLELLDISGCLVTIDAMGCQRKIAKKIIDKGGEYLLAVKGNQEGLEAAFDKHFPISAIHNYQGDHFTTEEKSRERTEQRFHIVSDIPNDSDFVDLALGWPGLKKLGVVVSTRAVGDDIPELTVRYYISSADLTAQRLASAVREHWHIENRLHYKLDVGFREDECRIRREDGGENFAKLRHVALNLLNAETSHKGGVKSKRKRAGLSTDYLEKVLAALGWQGVS